MSSEPEEPALFDLPLAPPAPPAAAPPHASDDEPVPRRSRSRAAPPESLSLFGDQELDELEARDEPEARAPRATRQARESRPVYEPHEPTSRPVPVPRPPRPAAGAASDAHPETAAIAVRLRAALGDLVVLAAAGALAAAGVRLMGVPLGLRELPALLAFVLAFSFLYCVVSLAFWGQTPGMSWTGLVARTDETEPLSFGQTALRWLGHWLTWSLAGLPGLLALTGRSLADRLSGSETYELQPRH